jgi:hypothetical protein
MGIFPGLFIPFIIPGYWDWIAESWNEGYTGINKISIYVLPIVLEEFNKEAEPEAEKIESETEKLEEEVGLTDSTKPEPSRQAPTESKHTDISMKHPKEEVLLTDTTKPEPSQQSPTESKHTDTPMKHPKEEVLLRDSTKSEPSRQAPTKSKHIDSPMKGPVSMDHQKNRSSQRSVLNSNITEMSRRSKTNNNQVPVANSREASFELYHILAYNPPKGCSEEVKHKLNDIWIDIRNKKNFNAEAINQILELDLLAPNALTELDDYSLIL